MDLDEWEGGLPDSVLRDPMWRTKAYRLATFLTELAQRDRAGIEAHPHLRDVMTQLYTCIGSIGANIAEGYSRMTARDRARFFEYALGSAREARHWYFAARPGLATRDLRDRLDLLDETIRLLVAMVTRQRNGRSGIVRADR